MKAKTDSGLQVHGVHLRYGARDVLCDLQLPALQPGRVVALIGPNGAGKSSLLRALAGLLPIRGEVRLDGRSLTAMKPMERAQHIGFMPQAMPDAIGLSVTEALIGSLRTDPRSAYLSEALLMRRIHALLARLDLLGLASRPLSALSGGQRQIASLAQAMIREPRLLLLDEPTSALDLRHQVDVMSLVRSAAQDGRIVVVVLHDLMLAARWADDVVVLHEGRVEAVGTPQQVVTAATLARVYRVRATVSAGADGGLQIAIQGPLDADRGACA